MIRRFRYLRGRLLLIFLLSGISFLSFGNQIQFTGQDVLIGQYLEIAEDPTHEITFDKANQLHFHKSSSSAPNFGFSSSTWWIRFTIKNDSKNKNLYLELGYPMIHDMELYNTDEPSRSQRIQKHDSFNKRIVRHQNPSFLISVPNGESNTYYIKIRENTQIVLPIFLRGQNGFLESTLTGEVLMGIYIGVLLVMFFYNLFLYFSIREVSYLHYVLYILFIGLTQLSLTGYGFKLLWSDHPDFNTLSSTLFSAMSGLFAVLFFQNFLFTKEKTPLLNKCLYIVLIGYLFSVIFKLAGNEFVSFMLTNFSGIASIFLAITISAIILRDGYRPAMYFLVAWSVFFIGLALFVLRNLDILPYNTFTNYTMQAGTAIEVILLSFALADKINILKQEKELSQEQALRISLENERIITQQNVILEKNVQKRTKELQQANTDLTDTLNQLKDTQTQLIESEKMASLGQLTAGIAHEINNPINFVSSNIRPLRRDIDDLLSILDAYEKLLPPGTYTVTEEQLQEIDDLKDDLDPEYIKTELGILLKGMEDGAHRTVEIVKGLKMFARVDDTDLNMVDINEGIESTLVILNYQIGTRLKLVRELDSIPNVEGFGGKLNQVFMNIITNSIHVLMKDTEHPNPTIWVKTWMSTPEHVTISIKDNGSGMTPEVKAKIFEPFFTTKQVGEGTGLGLSIVFKIVEVHNGTINVNTSPGQGTEFVITLPILKKKNPILTSNG
jgi:signal transduction histidine kinase